MMIEGHTIETARLILRRFRPDEVGTLIALRADPEVIRYLGGAARQSPASIEQRFKFYLSCYESHGFGVSAVVRKADGLMIGSSGLQPLEDTGEIEVGYAFDKPFWGQGYATEAAAAWLRYGFEHVGLRSIVAVTDPANVGSWRVMEKLGMLYRGRERHYDQECKVYAITSDQFRAAHDPHRISETANEAVDESLDRR